MAAWTLLEGIFLDGLLSFPLVSAGFTGVLVRGHVQHLAEKQRAGMTWISLCQPPSVTLRIFSAKMVDRLHLPTRLPHDVVGCNPWGRLMAVRGIM